MASVCSACKVPCTYKCRPKDDEVFGAPCDLCCNFFCKKCANITTTEAHAIALTHRTIVFYCYKCKEVSRDLPKASELLRSYEKIKSETANKDARIDTLEKELQEVSNQLQTNITENHEKERHIKGLKRKTMDFEDEVFRAEKELENTIQVQKEEIARINTKHLGLIQGIRRLTEELEESKEKIVTLEKDLEEIHGIRKSLLTSVETLEMENNLYVQDLKRANLELLALRQKCLYTDPVHEETSPPKQNQMLRRLKENLPPLQNNRILIAGSDVRGYLPLMKSLTDRKYDINSQRLRKTSVRELLDLSLPYCQHFTQKDFVFLFTDPQDSCNGENLGGPELKKKLIEFQHTNLILIGPTPILHRPILNKIIAAQNFVIKNCFIGIPSATFVPLTSPGPIQKNYLAEYLVYCFILNEAPPVSDVNVNSAKALDSEAPSTARIGNSLETPMQSFEQEHQPHASNMNTFLDQPKGKVTVDP